VSITYIQSFTFVGSPTYGIAAKEGNEFTLWWNGCKFDHAFTLEGARHKMFAKLNKDIQKHLRGGRDSVRDLEIALSKLNAGGLDLLGL